MKKTPQKYSIYVYFSINVENDQENDLVFKFLSIYFSPILINFSLIRNLWVLCKGQSLKEISKHWETDFNILFFLIVFFLFICLFLMKSAI